jgi:hypothetical protein
MKISFKHILKSVAIATSTAVVLLNSVSAYAALLPFTKTDVSSIIKQEYYRDAESSPTCASILGTAGDSTVLAPTDPSTVGAAPTYIAAGNIPATGEEVASTTYGGSFKNGVFVPQNDNQDPTHANGPSDSNGIGSDNLPLAGRTAFAELSVNQSAPFDFSKLGNLPLHTKLEIKFGGKTVIAEKDDVGGGAGDINSKPRALNLWWETAQLLDFKDGTGTVTIHAVDPATPLTPLGSTVVTQISGSVVPQPVYFVGDSIGTQIQSGLQAAFSTGGWTYKGSAISSRNLKGGSVQPDGLAQIDADAAYIATAKYIVVELGTNASGFSVANVQAMIDKIRGISPTATILWVNTAVVNKDSLATQPGGLDNVNTIIKEQSSLLTFQVIPWNAVVFGDTADPTKMEGLPDPNGYISLSDGLNVHLTTAGIGAMTAKIIGSITNQQSSTATSSSCSCSPSAALTGSDDEEKIYFYLTTQKGLTPIQAAGIMGNMQGEAHFEPRLVEYGFLNSRDEVSIAGQPTSLDDNVPPNRNKDGTPSTGIPGYGIVQFTSAGYKQDLRNISAQTGVKAGDLGLQLDYLWGVLSDPTGSFLNKVLNPIKASSDVNEVTEIFMRKFEVPGDPEGTLPIRKGFAAQILATMSTRSGPSASAPSSESGCVPPPQPGDKPADTVIVPIVEGNTTNIPCAAGADVTPPGGADGYRHGQLTKIEICNVQGITINSQISKQVDDLITAAKAAGLSMTGGAQGFRSMNEQLGGWHTRCGDWPITNQFKKPPCKGAQLARPGYSNHQMGLAIDFTCNGGSIGEDFASAQNSPCWKWLLEHSQTYGMPKGAQGTEALAHMKVGTGQWMGIN